MKDEWWVILRKTGKSDQIWENWEQQDLCSRLKIKNEDVMRFVFCEWLLDKVRMCFFVMLDVRWVESLRWNWIIEKMKVSWVLTFLSDSVKWYKLSLQSK